MVTYIKLHWRKVSLILFLFLIFFCQYQYKMPKRNFADFHVYYYAGNRMLNSQDVYDLNAYKRDGVATFKYPPLFALVSALFALTSERMAASFWFIFNFILIIIFVVFLGKLFFKDSVTYKQKKWIYFWSLFLTSRFYLDNFDEGQVNFLMMTTLLLGIYAVHKKKELLAGLLIGFSILVKYMSAIFIPYFLFKKKYKLLIYICLSLVFYSFLPVLFLGWENNLILQKQYLPYLCSTSLDKYSLSDYANQSLMSAIIRLFSDYGSYGINLINLSDFNLGFFIGGLYILLFILCLYPKKKNEIFNINDDFNTIDISLLFICVALLNPNAWLHAFIFLTVGYMALFLYLFKIRFLDRTVIILIIVSFILHSLTNSFLTNFWAGELFEIYSFVTFGAIFLFIALLKIKFFPIDKLNT